MECRGIADQKNLLRTTRTKERQKMKRPKEGDRIADLDPSNNQEVEHVNSKQILDFPSQKQLRELYQGIHRRDQIFLCTETVRSTCVNKHSTSKRKTFNQILSQHTFISGVALRKSDTLIMK